MLYVLYVAVIIMCVMAGILDRSYRTMWQTCFHCDTKAGKIHCVDGGVASEYDIVCANCDAEVGYFAYGYEQYVWEE